MHPTFCLPRIFASTKLCTNVKMVRRVGGWVRTQRNKGTVVRCANFGHWCRTRRAVIAVCEFRRSKKTNLNTKTWRMVVLLNACSIIFQLKRLHMAQRNCIKLCLFLELSKSVEWAKPRANVVAGGVGVFKAPCNVEWRTVHEWCVHTHTHTHTHK